MHQTMVSVPSLRGVFVLTAAVTRASMAHICSYLAVNASRLSDKTLTLCLGKAKTFRTVHSEVAALSQALRGALGVTPGSRIGLIAKGTDEFLQASHDLEGCPILDTQCVGRCAIWRSGVEFAAGCGQDTHALMCELVKVYMVRLTVPCHAGTSGCGSMRGHCSPHQPALER